MGSRFVAEMMYAECSRCGHPVLLDPDQTEDVILWSGLDPRSVDAGCMILSEGCPNCHPEEEFFSTHIVRLQADGFDTDVSMGRGI